MSRRRTPEVIYLDDGSAQFRVPYDAGWVAGVKALPVYAREYDPESKTWMVDAGYVEVIVTLTRRVFGTLNDADDAYAAPHAAAPDAFSVLHLRPSAPPELIDSAYRCLAKLVHPDRGGSHEQMLQLTSAYDALKAS